MDDFQDNWVQKILSKVFICKKKKKLHFLSFYHTDPVKCIKNGYTIFVVLT